jgi:hypothetical protein
MCLARGIVIVATVADHIEPHGGNWNLFLTGKLQSLCEHCHNSSKRRIDLARHHAHASKKTAIRGRGWGSIA